MTVKKHDTEKRHADLRQPTHARAAFFLSRASCSLSLCCYVLQVGRNFALNPQVGCCIPLHASLLVLGTVLVSITNAAIVLFDCCFFFFFLQSGLKILPYKNSHQTRATDRELHQLTPYLMHIAELPDFTKCDHNKWKNVVIAPPPAGAAAAAASNAKP